MHHPSTSRPPAATPTHILAVQSNPSLRHPVSDAVFIPTHHIVLAANCAHIPRVPVSRPQIRSGWCPCRASRQGLCPAQHLPRRAPAGPAHKRVPCYPLCYLMSAGPKKQTRRSRRPLCTHLRTPSRATFLAASASGDRMSALTALNRTVSTI